MAEGIATWSAASKTKTEQEEEIFGKVAKLSLVIYQNCMYIQNRLSTAKTATASSLSTQKNKKVRPEVVCLHDVCTFMTAGS